MENWAEPVFSFLFPVTGTSPIQMKHYVTNLQPSQLTLALSQLKCKLINFSTCSQTSVYTVNINGYLPSIHMPPWLCNQGVCGLKIMVTSYLYTVLMVPRERVVSMYQKLGNCPCMLHMSSSEAIWRQFVPREGCALLHRDSLFMYFSPWPLLCWPSGARRKSFYSPGPFSDNCACAVFCSVLICCS